LKFKLPKLDKDKLFTDLVLLGTVSVVLFIGIYWGFKKFGLFSYNGLSKDQVDKSYLEFQKRYPVISKVGGYLGGKWFERGIAGSGGPIYYFHYWSDANSADFQIYPEGFETWSTDPGIFGIGKLLTGNAMYP